MSRGCGSGRSSPPSSSTRRSSTPTAARAPPTPSASEGMDIAYDGVGLPSAADLAGQYGRTAVPGQSQRQPAVAGTGRRLPGQGRRPVPAGGLPQDPACGATPNSPRPSIWTDGTKPGDIRFLFGYRRHDAPQGPGRRPAGRRVQPPGATAAVRDQDRPRASGPSGSSPRSSAGAGYETIHLLEEMVAEFDYRPVACKKSYRVVVLRKRLGIDKGQCGCSRSIATSSTSPTTAT